MVSDSEFSAPERQPWPPQEAGPQPWPPPPPQWPTNPPSTQPSTTPRYWYGIGAALLTVGIIGGIGALVAGLIAVMQGPTDEFDAKSSATMSFAAGTSMIIYVADVEPQPKLTSNTRCTARDEKNGEATVTRYNGSMSINRWHALYVVTATQAGNYTISCDGYSDIYYGVGPRASTAAKVAVFAGPLVGFALFTAGLVVVLVTASKRRRPASSPYPYQYQYPFPPGLR